MAEIPTSPAALCLSARQGKAPETSKALKIKSDKRGHVTAPEQKSSAASPPSFFLFSNIRALSRFKILAKTRKIAPHLVLDVTDEMAIMQEEIFGPLLPIKTITDASEPLQYINSNPRPLAAYYFGDDQAQQELFARHTTSGALVINDVMTHASIDSLPFGGVGASGMGAYHGVHGFRRFTHAKPVVVQSKDGASNLRLRAPYSNNLQTIQAFFAG